MKEVYLTITSEQFETEDDVQQMKSAYPARYAKKDQNYYLFYKESTEEGTEDISVRVVLENKKLCVMRSGAVSANLSYELDRETESVYETPYGQILLGIKTTYLSVEERNDKLTIKVEYSLKMNGVHTSYNRITLYAE